MNALAHWNQFKELEALHNSLGSLFGRPQAQRLEGQEEPLRVPEWTPLVDISEDANEYLIKAELPEVRKEDVKITMEDGTLTITGDRQCEKEGNGRNITGSSALTAALAAVFRSRMTPAPPKSPLTSKTACSKCIWPRTRKPDPSKSRSASPDAVQSEGRAASPVPCIGSETLDGSSNQGEPMPGLMNRL